MSEEMRKILRIVHIIFLVIIAIELIRRFATGQSTPHLIFILLLLMAPFKFYDNHVITRKQFEDTGRGDEYKKIVRKSIVQGLIIMTLFVVGTVIYVVYIK